ncbi:helix-turn-helix domain-containing protein [Salicibibacter kimchii]|uniref:XRE family transcriptional regulator n=1 Tax=Salicibibacter kimchii TaxID=2099786 RepID=A0A345C2H7_9BACI|nr:helix-turn-helix transcriptional regulator [Salicibibacter kimchii]AXF57408.1 XRE family transcriptional regulator [Salicibibacter kimchii]
MGLIHCNLRVLMAERGLNIQNVKDHTSLSRTTISNLANNYGSGIQFDTLLELCELLSCKPGDLLTYIEIEPEFEVITEKPDLDIEEDTHVVNEEGDGFDYVSEIKTFLDMRCDLIYEGGEHKLNFIVYVQYGIDADKHINKIDIGLYQSLHKQLDKYLIPHAKEYFLEELSEFLIGWGHDWFYGEEIEGITGLTVNYGHLS